MLRSLQPGSKKLTDNGNKEKKYKNQYYSDDEEACVLQCKDPTEI